ncbi:uncharacterized protein LOC114738138 [Neltuma alba]|uniref:uncharacterized protein LOC114738138 n=1 Tax=Neltuma alba TaxID=207710 RepID=UPI0010A456AD|nr:uncharacterized protein LOC114738138 [Prosopis alba]
MVQRKVTSKALIHADNGEFDKHLEHLQQSSHHQDGVTSGDETNKSRSIQLSDLEAFQSSPSRRSFSKPGKPSPSHVPITAKSQKTQQPLMRTDTSIHYMKPTISSGAKELFPASLSNSQADYDYKDQKEKLSSNWKASVVPGKQPAKTLTRPSSLRNSLSPKRPMTDPRVTESQRTSVMKDCPYTFCSLNGHCHTPLPRMKSFLSERRSLFKAEKTMKQEELSLQRLKVPFITKVFDTEQIVIDGNSAGDDAEVDFFIEIYANVKEHESKPAATGHGHETGKLESSEELQDQEVIKFIIEENSLAARGDNVKHITTNMSDESPELESNSKKYFKKYYDDPATKADTMLSIHQEHNEESASESHPPSCSHKGTSMEICYKGIRFNDWEQLGSSEIDDCDFEATDTEWKEEQFCTSKLEERVVLAEEETEFRLESSSESLLEASVKSDKIVSTRRLEKIEYLVEEASQEAKAKECACFEAQPLDTVLDQEPQLKAQRLLHKIDDTDEGKDSSPETDDGSTSQATHILMKDVQSENIFTAQDKEMLEAIESGANKLQGTSCTGTEEEKRSKNWRGEMKHKIPVKDDEQLRKFDQRMPNFLPLIPNPEREKVILKHQIMDERKIAEQWMLDHALRQAVTKLAPVRKSKVALLVEAFEAVMPITQKEKPLKKGSAFAHGRTIHA